MNDPHIFRYECERCQRRIVRPGLCFVCGFGKTSLPYTPQEDELEIHTGFSVEKAQAAMDDMRKAITILQSELEKLAGGN